MALCLGLGLGLDLDLDLAKALVPFVFGFSPPLLSVAKRFTSVTSASRTPTPIFAITWLAMALPKLLRVEMTRVEMKRVEMTRCEAARAAADALSVSAAPCPSR